MRYASRRFGVRRHDRVDRVGDVVEPVRVALLERRARGEQDRVRGCAAPRSTPRGPTGGGSTPGSSSRCAGPIARARRRRRCSRIVLMSLEQRRVDTRVGSQQACAGRARARARAGRSARVRVVGGAVDVGRRRRATSMVVGGAVGVGCRRRRRAAPRSRRRRRGRCRRGRRRRLRRRPPTARSPTSSAANATAPRSRLRPSAEPAASTSPTAGQPGDHRDGDHHDQLPEERAVEPELDPAAVAGAPSPTSQTSGCDHPDERTARRRAPGAGAWWAARGRPRRRAHRPHRGRVTTSPLAAFVLIGGHRSVARHVIGHPRTELRAVPVSPRSNAVGDELRWSSAYFSYLDSANPTGPDVHSCA